MHLDTPKSRFALQVVRKLREHGYEAYWAGGCVRDLLLNQQPDDYDVATSARPEEVRRLFGFKHTVAVGAAFGVIIVVGPPEAGQVEVATFRSDVSYSDGRRPDSVTFATAREDVLRRDFTINGMLYDPLTDQVLDYIGGQEDLRRGIVRAIGDARKRLGEDKLRMLRAVRFSARFGFPMEPRTASTVAEMAHQITVVSAERITQEFRLMLIHSTRRRAMELCAEMGLLSVVLPALAPVLADKARWKHTLDVLDCLKAPSFPLAFAALLHALGEPSVDIMPSGQLAPAHDLDRQAEQVARQWRFSNEDRERLVWLLANRGALIDAREKPWPLVQRLLVHPAIDELIALHRAELAALGRPQDDLDWCDAQRRRPQEEWNPPALLTGDDLIAHGVPKGKIYQRLLDAVRDAQLEGRVQSKADALKLVDELRAKQAAE